MRTYLFVDDNRAFAENLAEIVRDLGDEVEVATGGVQALEQLKARRFDALVTDMRMPVMSGAELVQALRRVDPEIPVIVASAYSGDDDLAVARNEGLLAILSKPVDLQRLIELLRSARRAGIVALIEDDEQLLDNLSEAFRSKGFTALTASSVVETERLAPVRPFAAVCDLRVKGGPDGEAMRRLLQKFPGLPTLVMTAHDSTAAPAPHVELFRKPFETEALLRQLERLYAEKAAR
jgi:DNA-binding NtrC family response regulator